MVFPVAVYISIYSLFTPSAFLIGPADRPPESIRRSLSSLSAECLRAERGGPSVRRPPSPGPVLDVFVLILS
jgi:hypothetical protein